MKATIMKMWIAGLVLIAQAGGEQQEESILQVDMKALNVRLNSPHRAWIGPNEHLPRRGPSGHLVTTQPVLVDVDVDLSGSPGITDPSALQLCFILVTTTTTKKEQGSCPPGDCSCLGGESTGISSQSRDTPLSSSLLPIGPLKPGNLSCAPLMSLHEPPTFTNLTEGPGAAHMFCAWLVDGHRASPRTSFVFEVTSAVHKTGDRATVASDDGSLDTSVAAARDEQPPLAAAGDDDAQQQQQQPAHLRAPPPTFHSVVPYDRDLVARVGQCVELKMAAYDAALLLQAEEESAADESESAGATTTDGSSSLKADRVYTAAHSNAFLGATLRGILNPRHLKQLGNLVECATSVQRKDGVPYDGEVARQDFGVHLDPSYEPHRLVNLNPFLNAGLLPEVKERVYEAVHAAARDSVRSENAVIPSPVLLDFDYDNNAEEADATEDADAASVDAAPAPAPKSTLPPLLPALGFRCVEHISYPVGVGLDEHTDEDSVFTVSVLISDHSEYQGGNFELLGKTEVAADFKPGDGLVFASEQAHRVTPVTGGTRKVLVVELWPFPDGAIPSRVTAPQRYPPPIREVHATAQPSVAPPSLLSPSSSSPVEVKVDSDDASQSGDGDDGGDGGGDKEDRNAASNVEKKEGLVGSQDDGSDNVHPFGDMYVVVRGSLVATGGLPISGRLAKEGQRQEEVKEGKEEEEGGAGAGAAVAPLDSLAVALNLYTWREAIETCDQTLTCLGFTFYHPTAWLGREDEAAARYAVEFKREASPIRIRGEDVGMAAGPYGGGIATGHTIPEAGMAGVPQRWTAIKPWPMSSLVDEWVRATNSGGNSGNENTGGAVQQQQQQQQQFTANYRECEEWALDGHCNRLPVFMRKQCSFFCREAAVWSPS